MLKFGKKSVAKRLMLISVSTNICSREWESLNKQKTYLLILSWSLDSSIDWFSPFMSIRTSNRQFLVPGHTDRVQWLCFVWWGVTSGVRLEAGCHRQVELNGWILIGVLPIDQEMLGVIGAHACDCPGPCSRSANPVKSSSFLAPVYIYNVQFLIIYT